jgi:predicted  nucleic acid-binding Zn-ribbon protein
MTQARLRLNRHGLRPDIREEAMTKKRATILDKAFKHLDDKIAALQDQIDALRLARQHLEAEQETAVRRRPVPTLTDKAS